MSMSFSAKVTVSAAEAVLAIPAALATLIAAGISAAVAAALMEAEAGARLVEQEGWESWMARMEARARELTDAGLPEALARSRAAYEAFQAHPVPLTSASPLSLHRQALEEDLIRRARSEMIRLGGSVRSPSEAALRAMREAIRSRPLFRALVELEDPEVLDEGLVTRLGIQELRERLGAALFAGFERLEEALVQTSADGWHRALQSLGYTVEEARRPGAAALWATRGSAAIALRITRDGVEGDMAGFQGPACMAEWTRLQQEMARQGFHVRDPRVVTHNRFEGGSLISRARAGLRAGGSMAEMLLEGASIRQRQPVAVGPAPQVDRRRQIQGWIQVLEAQIGNPR
jgi:hypothetical protein